jgi:hypothetical protein
MAIVIGKQDEIGGTSSMHGREAIYVQKFSWKNQREETMLNTQT